MTIEVSLSGVGDPTPDPDERMLIAGYGADVETRWRFWIGY